MSETKACPVTSMSLDELEDERLALIEEETALANEVADVEGQIDNPLMAPAGADEGWLLRAEVALHVKRKQLRRLRARLRAVESQMGRAKRARNIREATEENREDARCFVEAARAVLSESAYLDVWKLARALRRQRESRAALGGEGRTLAG